LNSGEKIAILAGAGCSNATDSLIRVAERLQAGIAKALLGKATVPDDLPFVTGSAGWLGTRASNEMLARCDTLLLVGSQFPYTEFLPRPGQARAVQIDIDGSRVGSRYPTDVGLVGDARETLDALLPLLRERGSLPGTWRNEIEKSVRETWKEAEAQAKTETHPLNPARVFWEMSEALPDNVMLAGDCGTATYWYGKLVKARRGMLASLSSTLATMGSAIPYALAAKFNYPDRPAIALVGDGAMQMNGLNALITVAQHYQRWSDPRLIVLVLNNQDLSYVTWEQRVMEGDPKFAPSQVLYDFPYARYAELLGLGAIRIERSEEVGPAWQRALAADRPFLIEARTDANGKRVK